VPDARAADDKRVIARNTLANSGVQLLQLVAAFFYMPFLISSFGLANYGVFMLAGSLSIYLGLLDFGVNPTVVKHVAEYVASGRRAELARLISNSAAYYAAVGVVAALALALFARYGVGTPRSQSRRCAPSL
jgi:O-antigen/teichoic acid export membrane protein